MRHRGTTIESRDTVRAQTRTWNEAKWKPEADERNVVFTPRWLVDRIRKDVFGGVIHLDPATTPDNPVGAERFVHLPDDGILVPWEGNVFVNPPWGRTMPIWVSKALTAPGRVTMLTRTSTDSRWFQHALEQCSDVLFFGRRLDYEFPGKAERPRGAKGALFCSVLFGFGVSVSPLSDLGVVLRPGEAA